MWCLLDLTGKPCPSHSFSSAYQTKKGDKIVPFEDKVTAVQLFSSLRLLRATNSEETVDPVGAGVLGQLSS